MQLDAGETEPDAGNAAADAGRDDADAGNLPPPDGGPVCADPAAFDYSCQPGNAASCPEGLCILGYCVAPVVNPQRWDSCGNGACESCETPSGCPADCAPPPVFTGAKSYDPMTTMTVKVHGYHFHTDAQIAAMVYGQAVDIGEGGQHLLHYAPHLVDGLLEPTVANQVVGVDYVGGTPADIFTPEEIAEIEAYALNTPEALHRYALVVARFIRHRMALSGATHVNIICHSMGCHTTRYMIEHDLGQLASQNVITHWTSVSGVVCGSELARLYDNPELRNVVERINLNSVDFIHMNADYARDHVAAWDHRLFSANNPLWQGILIHSVIGTDWRLRLGPGISPCGS